MTARHAPVQREKIGKRSQNDDGVAAHFRDDVGQRRLNAVNALNKDVLQLSRASGLHVAQRHTRKLFKPLLPYICQHGKGRPVRLRRGQ